MRFVERRRGEWAYLNTIIAVRVSEELFKSCTIEKFVDQHLASVVHRDTNAFLNNVGAKLLDRQSADIASKLTDDAIAEPVVVQIEDILNDLTEMITILKPSRRKTKTTYVVTIWILYEG